MYNSGDNNAALILISPMIDVPLNTLRTSFYTIGSAYHLAILLILAQCLILQMMLHLRVLQQ